jgi:hypothetical protein
MRTAGNQPVVVAAIGSPDEVLSAAARGRDANPAISFMLAGLLPSKRHVVSWRSLITPKLARS